MSVVIGLTGAAGTGKSTVSLELVQRYGFTSYAFADPLKAMLRAFFLSLGETEETIRRYIDGDLKEVPQLNLGDNSPRRALQTLGTDWGRDLMWEDLWLHHLRLRLADSHAKRIVIDDVRMDNEARFLINVFGAEIWEVTPEGLPRRHPPKHPSEYGIKPKLIRARVTHQFTRESLAADIDAKMEARGISPEGSWRVANQSKSASR